MSEKIRVEYVGMTFFNERTNREVVALSQVDLSIQEGEFVCLLGPSGCGKTTLLNSVAGFLHPTEGQILVDGKLIKEPGSDRGIVFQEYGLFPWFTVGQNIAFGPRMRGASQKEQNSLIREFVDLVHLQGFEDHYPGELSGGMKQRVSIARVLASGPDILLMDEPFGSLDAQTREIMQEELLRIWEMDKKTCLFVTHSIAEAVYLGDRIVIISARPGRVKQIIDVKIPRLRDRTSAEFFEIYRHVDKTLREEMMKEVKLEEKELREQMATD